jgi:hypothetical protein
MLRGKEIFLRAVLGTRATGSPLVPQTLVTRLELKHKQK